MKHEFVELVVHLLWNWMVVCLNLGLREIGSFLPNFFSTWMWRSRLCSVNVNFRLWPLTLIKAWLRGQLREGERFFETDHCLIWNLSCEKFCVIWCFWKFSRNRLTGLQSRQATHAKFPSLCTSAMNRLVAMNCRQATRANLARFLCFLISSLFWSRKESS